MNTRSRIITGVALVVFGVFLLGGSFFWEETDSIWVSAIYGLISFVVGGFILFNKKEDEIEQIKLGTKGVPPEGGRRKNKK